MQRPIWLYEQRIIIVIFISLVLGFQNKPFTSRPRRNRLFDFRVSEECFDIAATWELNKLKHTLERFISFQICYLSLEYILKINSITLPTKYTCPTVPRNYLRTIKLTPPTPTPPIHPTSNRASVTQRDAQNPHPEMHPVFQLRGRERESSRGLRGGEEERWVWCIQCLAICHLSKYKIPGPVDGLELTVSSITINQYSQRALDCVLLMSKTMTSDYRYGTIKYEAPFVDFDQRCWRAAAEF